MLIKHNSVAAHHQTDEELISRTSLYLTLYGLSPHAL